MLGQLCSVIYLTRYYIQAFYHLIIGKIVLNHSKFICKLLIIKDL